MIEYTVKVWDDSAEWYLNGKLHKDNGPAIEWKDGRKQWFLEGMEYSEANWLVKTQPWISIDDIVNSVIDLNNNLQKQASRFRCSTYLPAIPYAVEYQTVAYNPGRQCGKTYFIANNASDDDIVIALNSRMLKTLQDRLINKPETTLGHKLSMDKGTYDKVWIDEASLFSKEVIDYIYFLFAGNCNQFVLLG
jgi:hypothetical protein